MERTRYLVHGRLMIIRRNGQQWRGLWNDPGDRHGLRRTWPFGEEDPRPHLQQVQVERTRPSATLSCNEAIRSQLRAICERTGETQRAVLERLSLQEEARLAQDCPAPVARVRSIGVDPRTSIVARRETVERFECCATLTHERLGHLVARVITHEWQRCLRPDEVQ